MAKVFRVEENELGFPSVRWEQRAPTGQSAYSVQQATELKIAAVIMVFVFVAVWAWSEQFWGAALAAMVIGGMCLAGDRMFKGGVKVWDIHIPGPEPRPGAAEDERRARGTAIIETQVGGMDVIPDEETQELYLYVCRGPRLDALKWVGSAPLASIQSLEVGRSDEWFEELSQAQLRRMVSLPDSWVIVASTLGHGVLWIAESGGSRADISALHGLLLKLFVMDAPAMLERWKEELREREASTITIEGALEAKENAAETGDEQRAKNNKVLGPPAASEGNDAAGKINRAK